MEIILRKYTAYLSVCLKICVCVCVLVGGGGESEQR